VLVFIGLTLVGVDHTLFLAMATFVLCLVPTLGTVLAWGLIALIALVQPGGGMALVLKASGVVLVVVALENFVLGPRIVGKMMELHPVLLIALLPVAQYFFGVWGLILATPVIVYVIHVIILQHGLPGSEPSARPPAAGSALLRAHGPLQDAEARKELRAEQPEVIQARIATEETGTRDLSPQPGEACGPAAR
jgi:predicted PurR-regulated permease PerM